MKIKKAKNGKNIIKLSQKEWKNIGKNAGWITIHGQNKNQDIYMLENGLIYDKNGDDLFTISELGKYSVPLFKTPREANEFLEKLKNQTGRSFGRIDEKNYLQDIRYKDTKKEKFKAKMELMEKQKERWQRGVF